MQTVDGLEYEWLSNNNKFKVIKPIVHDYCWKILDKTDNEKYCFLRKLLTKNTQKFAF